LYSAPEPNVFHETTSLQSFDELRSHYLGETGEFSQLCPGERSMGKEQFECGAVIERAE
jgi:hypothetical protein